MTPPFPFRPKEPAQALLLAAALLISCAALVASWNLPILELHGFRQTQTAISSYWMASSSNWLAYPTPILGYPWSIPLEFPVYQALALAVSKALPVTLDQAGRLVSWLFAIASLWPLRRCLRELGASHSLVGVSSVFFLLSPLYLFWSRAFLIESTALFLSLGFLALVVVSRRRRDALVVSAMFACALLAALVKITTFFGFALAAAAVLVLEHWRHRHAWGVRDTVSRYAPAAVSVLAALLALEAWLHFADLEKSKTVWGAALGSHNLDLWNFGTWEQRIGPALWRDVVFGRAPGDLLGFRWLLPVLALPALLVRGNRALAWAALLLYLAPFLVFTNVHFVHNYYQYANGIFLLVLAACGVEAIAVRAGRWLGFAAVLLVCVLMLAGFRRDFLGRIQWQGPDVTRPLALADVARRNSSPDEVILAFGLDWSAEVPYYAERRAMLVPDWIQPNLLLGMQADPHRMLGDLRLGLVIDCPNQLDAQPTTRANYRKLLATVTAGRTRTQALGCSFYR